MIFDNSVKKEATGLRWPGAERPLRRQDNEVSGEASFERDLILFDRQILVETQHRARACGVDVKFADTPGT